MTGRPPFRRLCVRDPADSDLERIRTPESDPVTRHRCSTPIRCCVCRRFGNVSSGVGSPVPIPRGSPVPLSVHHPRDRISVPRSIIARYGHESDASLGCVATAILAFEAGFKQFVSLRPLPRMALHVAGKAPAANLVSPFRAERSVPAARSPAFVLDGASIAHGGHPESSIRPTRRSRCGARQPLG